jgi:hypothetical protein
MFVGFSVNALHHERFHEKWIEEPPQVHTTSPTSTMLERAVQFGPTSTLVENPGEGYCCMNECHFFNLFFNKEFQKGLFNEALGKKNSFRHPEKEGTFFPDFPENYNSVMQENAQSNVNSV